MQVKTKKLNRTIGLDEFVNKIYSLSKPFQRIREKYDNEVNVLAQKYLKSNCTFKVGDIINIKDADGGYTQFEIQKLFPHINWEKRTVRIKAYGVISGEGVEDAEKQIWIDELNKVPVVVDPVEEAKQIVAAAEAHKL